MELLYTPSDIHSTEFKKQLEEKPVNVLFHGLFGMAENLRLVERILSPKYCCVSYDIPNHGRSPSLQNSNFISIAHMLHKTLESHIYPYVTDQKIHLFGHSLGGKIAGVYAILYPQHVRSLILLDIAPVEYPPHYRTEIRGLSEVAAMLAKQDISRVDRADIKKMMSGYVDDEITLGFLLKNLYVQDDFFKLHIDIANVSKDYDVLRSFPTSELSNKRYEGPSVCIRGEKSDYVLDSYLDALSTFFPNITLETVPNAGHIVHAENPKALANILSRY